MCICVFFFLLVFFEFQILIITTRVSIYIRYIEFQWCYMYTMRVLLVFCSFIFAYSLFSLYIIHFVWTRRAHILLHVSIIIFVSWRFLFFLLFFFHSPRIFFSRLCLPYIQGQIRGMASGPLPVWGTPPGTTP